MAVTATPRTPCHLTMQTRSLRVPDPCDNHTAPSCFVANSVAESRYRSVHTLAPPDPLHTEWGLVTFVACALHKLFVRSCDLVHHGLYYSHVCACTHHSSLQHLPFSVLTFVAFLCSHGRTSEYTAASRHHRVESLLLHGYSALRTTLSPTATI